MMTPLGPIKTPVPAPTDLDLSAPSYSGAYRLARKLAQTGDRAGAAVLFTGLLMLVPVEDGGLMGLDDEALGDRCTSDPRLDHDAALKALWNPPAWPSVATTKTTERAAA